LETDVADAVKWLLRLNPRHALQDDTARQVLAADIVEVSEHWGHDPWLITAMAYCESTFRPHAVGTARGELGIMQLHGHPTRGCDLSTARGGLECGARYLYVLKRRCGSVRCALNAYASGKCKVTPGSRADRMVRRRLRMAERLRGRFSE
jgi:soluble lytic murein transglycosylase-like protein